MSPRLSDLFLSSQSDERLVSLAQAGHERAFAAIVERYRPELYALARRLCSDGHGEDVVQQAFLSAFAALRSGADVKHLRGWLYQIVRNAAIRSRSPLCVPLDGETACAETLEDVVQQRAQAMSALSELARLPTRQRQAMVGTALDGLARADVASTMGVSEGAVRQLVHRARATLRTAVTAVTPWPLARWFAAVRPSGPGAAELAAGAGAASSGGIALKVGALLASGTLVTGVAAVDLHPAPAHRSGARAATPAGTQPRAGQVRGLELAAVGPGTLLTAATAHSRRDRARITGSGRSAVHPRASGVRVELRGPQHENSTATRREGGGVGGAGHGDHGEANQSGGEDRSSQTGTGSGSRGDGGSGHDGSVGGGTGERAGSMAAASGSGDGHGDRTGSGSHTLDAAVDGQSSGGGDGSGSHSGVGSGGGSTSSDSSGSGSGSGSSSGDDSSLGDAGASGH